MKKRVIGTVAVALAGVITVGTVLTHVSETAYAQESFVGIDSIIEDHGEENPFTIVEIVPDYGMAKLGYFFEGSEPFYSDDSGSVQSYQKHLADLNSAEERLAYMSGLEKALSSISTKFGSMEELGKAANVTTALSYVPYEESYIAFSGAQTLALTKPEELAAGTAGYKMTEVGDGNGDYTLDNDYHLAAEDEKGTHYSQNISYYSTIPTEGQEFYSYYLVTFAYSEKPAAGAGAYIVEKADPVEIADDQTDWNDIYSINDDGVYVKADSKVDGVDYYRVTFQHTIVPEEDTEEKTGEDTEASSNPVIYYTVQETSFDKNGTSIYGAVLDSQTPYVEAEDGRFVCEKTYTQVEEGKGTYSLTVSGSQDSKLDGAVKVERIYYTGGYVNNNIFKQAVFNQSGLLDAAGASDISIRVVVKTASDFNSYDGDMDMLYVSYSSQVAQTSGSMGTYGGSNDLSDKTVAELYEQVCSDTTRLPVILDYGIMTDAALNGTGIRTLATLLTASTISGDNIKRTADDNGGITVAPAGDISEFADADHFYVNENVLVVPSESNNFSFMDAFDTLFLDDTGKDDDTFQEDADDIGFGDVAATIISENTYRKVENAALENNTYGFYNQTVSKAIATEYIISYVYRRQAYVNEDLLILDVEPCTIDSTTQTAIKENIKTIIIKALGVTDEQASEINITVIHMSSAEFISKVEDLCKYDMIYLGLYTDHMNTKVDKNGDIRTIYNDSSMDGLVYTNIGDIQQDTSSLGMLDTEYNNKSNHYTIYNTSGSKGINSNNYVRYSGNDLTTEKLNAMKAYVKSGSPVILADNFLTTGGKDGKTTYVYDYKYDENGNRITSENGYIDNCSRMYELIDAIKDESNVMTKKTLESSAGLRTLKRYITLGKPKLSVNAGSKVSGQEYYNTTGSKITFSFNIENYGSANADATFYCYLYADYNADGRYSASEMVGANDYKISLNGVTQTAKSTTDEDGNDVYYYELAPTDSSTTYQMTYTISDDYVGVLPVKLKVSQSSNSYRYDSEQLYFYKVNTTKNTVVIKVLQIVASGEALGDKLFEDDSVSSISHESLFYTELNDSEVMKDYDITIDVISDTKYASVYGSNPSFLDDYDMLIVGIGDSFDFLSEQNGKKESQVIAAYQGISDFIGTGKSVLFTHDTTTWADNPNNGPWSYTLNKLLCPDVGFDRYGIYSSDLIRAGIKNLTSTSTQVYKVSDYYSLTQAKKNGQLTKDSYTGAELFKLITEEAQANSKDIAYKPNSDKQELVTEVQGRSSLKINDAGSTNLLKSVNSTFNTSFERTTTVELVNEGQILVYPYNILDDMKTLEDGINKKMTVAKTHGQYYQIDMNEDADNDGQSDATVWLSLKSDTANHQYEAATRDARNNYYIYTKGNVTYSGVGDNKMNESGSDHYQHEQGYNTEKCNKAEIDLYINTLVTAYSAGAHAPTITLKQTPDAGAGSGSLNTIYVGMDSKIEENLTDADGNSYSQVIEGEQVDSGYERVYYTIDDTNVTQGGVKKVSVKYYLVYDSKDDAPAEYRDIGSELTINETTVFAVEQDWDTYKGSKTEKESSLENITTGVTYACDIPYSILKDDEDETTIWVVATTSIWKQGANTTKKPSAKYSAFDYVKVQRIGLFDLD